MIMAAALLLAAPLSAQEEYALDNAMPVFTDKVKAELDYPLSRRNSRRMPFRKWRKSARAKLFECLGPAMPSAPFDMEVLQTERRDGYVAKKIAFNISAYERVPAYLLVPEGEGPFPALVLLHDHGAHFSIGKEKMVKPLASEPESVRKDAEEWSFACYDGVYVGDYFAANGFVVLSVDALFWGSRGRRQGVDYDAQQAFASNLEQMGYHWAGVVTHDDITSVNLLGSLPEVDAQRIGALGHSMGGKRTWMLASATDKVKAAAAVCWICTTDSLMTFTNNQNKGGSAWSMNVPNLVRFMDYADVASIACPKPMLFYNGERDKLFPVEGVKESYGILRDVWEERGAGDKLVTRIWDEKHYFNKAMQAGVLEFFKNNL